jgi:hypothetical protein
MLGPGGETPSSPSILPGPSAGRILSWLAREKYLEFSSGVEHARKDGLGAVKQ